MAPKQLIRVGTILAFAITFAGCGSSLEGRQQQVAIRGAEVMPFDIERTTHRWTRTRDGLKQTVVVDDPDDADQVRLVRKHLQLEADRFRHGDFEDPAAIHGTDMPGLALLRNHDGAITVTFAEAADGAILRFVTQDQRLVEALHEWSEAQLRDHGPHAESG